MSLRFHTRVPQALFGLLAALGSLQAAMAEGDQDAPQIDNHRNNDSD